LVYVVKKSKEGPRGRAHAETAEQEIVQFAVIRISREVLGAKLSIDRSIPAPLATGVTVLLLT